MHNANDYRLNRLPDPHCDSTMSFSVAPCSADRRPVPTHFLSSQRIRLRGRRIVDNRISKWLVLHNDAKHEWHEQFGLEATRLSPRKITSTYVAFFHNFLFA